MDNDGLQLTTMGEALAGLEISIPQSEISNPEGAATPVLSESEIEAGRERRTRVLIEEALRRDAQNYFGAITRRLPDMHPSRTRWTDPRLAANAAQIEAVRSWDFDVASGVVRVNKEVAVADPRFTSNDPPGLLLIGPTGRGKTRALFALMERLTERGRQFGYWFAGDWFAELGRQVRYGRDEAAEWVDGFDMPVLIMDDIGQEAVLARNEPWAYSNFFRLLDFRLGRGLPLIVSSNLNSEQLAAGGSERGGVRKDPLVRRLCDLCRVVRFV